MISFPSLPFFNQMILLPIKFAYSYNIMQSNKFCLTRYLISASDDPKKPKSFYLSFFSDILPEHERKYPTTSRNDKLKIAAKLWTSLEVDERKRIFDRHSEDVENYLIHNLRYRAKMGNQVTEKKKKTDNAVVSTCKKRKLKKLIELSGKPKRPPSAFILYLLSKRPTFPKEVNHRENVANAAKEYRSLPEEEKMKYKLENKKLYDAYREAIDHWEEKVIKVGWTDILPKKSKFCKDPADSKKS